MSTETPEARAKRLQLIPMEKLEPVGQVVKVKRPVAPLVVHLKRSKGVEIVSCDVYIGRQMYQGGWKLPRSKWANPFTLAKMGDDRARVLKAYEAHIRADQALLDDLPELDGKSLGCWCAPESCHGDILVKLFKELVMGGDPSIQ